MVSIEVLKLTEPNFLENVSTQYYTERMIPKLLRACLSALIILQLLHVPLPCPDLDGECRGTPIVSLLDYNAWHHLITGITPNTDIDRGPFNNSHSPERSPLSDSPFGDLAMVSVPTNTVSQLQSSDRYDELIPHHRLLNHESSKILTKSLDLSGREKRRRQGRSHQTLHCIWRI